MGLRRKTILSLLFFSFMSVGWGQDSSPPELTYFNFEPDTINLNNRNPIVFTYNIIDETGINGGWTYLRGPSDQTLYIQIFSGGQEMNFQTEYTFDDNTEEGLWVIDMYLYDILGNTINLSQSDLIDLGFPTEIFVTYGEPSLCDEGYTDIDGECYYQSDLDVLQQFIDNSQEGENPPPSDMSPIELGEQVWENGRLVYLCSSTNPSITCYMNYELSGEIPQSIGNLVQLRSLQLYHNKLTGEIPSEIGNLTNLDYLYLTDNQLSGIIPTWIESLVNLFHLDLQHNNLDGEIPSEIGNLVDLSRLGLSYNQLTGEIPPEIGNLTNLTHLYLNSNQLTGDIPQEICSQGDSSPSLYNNQLCPPYPECIEDYVGYQDTSECIQCSDGDINGDYTIDVLDVVIMVDCILINDCIECSDITGDGDTNVLDIVYLVDYILGP
jgi:hypothetical protein